MDVHAPGANPPTVHPPISLLQTNPTTPPLYQLVSLSNASLFIPILEGRETPGWVSLEDFLQSLHLVKVLGLYQDRQILHLAALRLKGPAREYVRARPGLLTTSLEEFAQTFRKRFGEKKDPASALSELLSVSQRPAEKVYDYGQRVKLLLDDFLLGNKISSDSEVGKVLTNKIAKMTFAKGLSPVVRRAVLSKKTSTLDDTVEAAREEELNASIGTATELPVAALEGTHLYDGDSWLKEELEKIQQKLVMSLSASPSTGSSYGSQVQAIRRGPTSRQYSSRNWPAPQDRACFGCGAHDHQVAFCPYTSRVVCFYCGKRGHIQRDCRARSRTQSPGRSLSPRRSASPRDRFQSRTREFRRSNSPASRRRDYQDGYRTAAISSFSKNGCGAPRR